MEKVQDDNIIQFSVDYLEGLNDRNPKLADEKVLEYLRLSPDELQKLKDQIRLSGGHISIAVHSFFSEQLRPEMQAFLSKYLSGNKVKAPIFVAEGPESLKEAKGWIIKNEYDKGENCYYLQTGIANGVPNLLGEDSYEEGVINQQFDLFGRILNSIGVRSVVVSGVYADACVEDMYVGLQNRGFAINIGSHAYVEKGVKNRQAGLPRGQKSFGKVKN